MIRLPRRTISRASVAIVVAATLTIATSVGARPNTAQLRGSAQALLQVEAAPNPCDDVWSFLASSSTDPTGQRPLSGVVSIGESYAVSHLSTLANVRADDEGRYALHAPLVTAGEPQLGRVDVRFSRLRPGPNADYRYAVQVQTCSDGSTCTDARTRLSAPAKCSAQHDTATLVVPGMSALQEVRIRFSR